MVNREELQIGNQLFYKDKLVTVKTIGLFAASLFNHYSAIGYEGLEPVPITEKKLLELGFTKDVFNYTDGCPPLIHYHLNNFKLFVMARKDDIMKDCFVPGFRTIIFDNINLESFHDFQNIYKMHTQNNLIPIPKDDDN